MSAFYLGLFYEDPQSGEVHEVEHYSRKPIDFSAPFIEPGAIPKVVVHNTNHVKIGCSKGSWEIVRVGLFDAKKEGNLLFSHRLPDPLKIDRKHFIAFAPGDYRILLEEPATETKGNQEEEQ